MNFKDKSQNFKISHLHQMLDKEIKDVQSVLQPEKDKLNTFTVIEQKLKQLQIKLETIQNESYTNGFIAKSKNKTFLNPTRKIKDSKVSSNNQQISSIVIKHKTPSKKKLSTHSEQNMFKNVQLKRNLIPKTQIKSALTREKSLGGSIKRKLKSSNKKSMKKLSFTINSKSITSFRPTLKKGQKSTKNLERIVSDYEYENKSLKKKVKELQTYKKEYKKLKQVFERDQKLRKKKMRNH